LIAKNQGPKQLWLPPWERSRTRRASAKVTSINEWQVKPEELVVNLEAIEIGYDVVPYLVFVDYIAT
jgi:hypothetical protein